MKTQYYCENCKDTFFEGKLPNINKSHWCGELARVVNFIEESESSEEQTKTH